MNGALAGMTRWMLALVIALAPALPGTASAQTAPPAPVTTIRTLATGTLEVAPTAWFVSVTWTVTADSAKLPAARAEATRQVRAALRGLGIADDAITDYSRAFETLNAFSVPVVSEESFVGRMSIRVAAARADAPQVKAVETALTAVFKKLGITESTFDDPFPTVADVPAAQRLVQAEAIRNARAEADAYARALGMRVIGVTVVSEAGDLLPPGAQVALQRRVDDAAQGRLTDPTRMPSALVHLEASLVVEFELAP